MIKLSSRKSAAYAALAVGGSLAYGASLGRVIPGWRPVGAAQWLTVSAGAGWLVLGPALIAGTRLPVMALADACLGAMARGEAVLLSAAAVNALQAAELSRKGWADRKRGAAAALFNAAAVALSNAVMARYLVRSLKALGAPPMRVLALWVMALNGTGAAVAWWLRDLPRGEGAT